MSIKPAGSPSFFSDIDSKLNDVKSASDLSYLVSRIGAYMDHNNLQHRIQIAMAIIRHPLVTTEHIRDLVYAIPLSEDYKVPTQSDRDAQQAWLDDVLNHPSGSIPAALLILLHWGPLENHLTINLPPKWDPLVTAITKRLERSTTTLRDTRAGEFAQYILAHEPDQTIHLAIADLLNSNWEGSLWQAYETAKAAHKDQALPAAAPDQHWYTTLA